MQKSGHSGVIAQSAWVSLILMAAVLLLPLLLYGGGGAARGGDVVLLPPSPSPAVSAPASPLPSAAPEAPLIGTEDRERGVKVLMGDEVVETDMASYLWGVVAAEMPASFEEDALRAQAVAARTYTLWKALHNKAHPQANVCTDYTCCQAWLSREEAMEKWGEQGAEYAAKLDKAVAATDGVVLYYDGQPIQAAFHASSAGQTQDAVAVWGSTVPYLKAVRTPEGEETPNYHTSVTLTAEQVRGLLEPLGCKLEEKKPEEWFAQLTYSEGGSVAAAEVGGVALRGNELRTALGLRSASFTVGYAEGAFTFAVTGYGHGVGLSQYGANALAREGKSWREILRWYYTGVEFGGYDGQATPAAPSDPPGTAGG